MLKFDLSAFQAISDEDVRVLTDGLASLFRERAIAFHIATSVAKERSLREPAPNDFSLPRILRLSRQLGSEVTGWSFDCMHRISCSNEAESVGSVQRAT